jgi:hypothetical protein
MIRIGSSCALSVNMALGYVVETRILTDGSTKWQEVCKSAIANKQYLILTPCVNDGMGNTRIPSDSSWKTTIDTSCKYLKSIGANINNCKISIINEPTKFFRDNGGVEQYAHFINMAYPIVKSYGLRTAAGNMEFRDAAILGNWYGYICANSQFEYLDIHIQGSCDNEQRTKEYSDFALGLANQYKKKLDCTEAFYGDITSSGGWNLLQIQLKHAERIGCQNFCNVFNDLDTSAFKVDTKPWYKLCFKINGVIHSNYWGHWKILMDTKHPIPNITIPIKEDDMELNYVKLNSINEETKTVQQILNDSGYMVVITGKCDANTVTKIKEFQTDNELKADGWVGKATWDKLLWECATGAERFAQLLTRKAVYR